MKKMFFEAIIKRTGALLLVLAMILSFVACGGEPIESESEKVTESESLPSQESVSESESESESETEPAGDGIQLSNGDLVLFENGVFNFRVIRPRIISTSDLSKINRLIFDMRELAGVKSIDLTTDEQYVGHEYSADTYEIVCGYTGFPESAEGSKDLHLNGYRVSVIGKKIVIVTKFTNALPEAIAAFGDYVKNNVVDGKVVIPNDLVIEGRVEDSEFKLISKYSPKVLDYESASFSPCGDDYEQATIKGVPMETYDSYLDSLEADGFTLYAENDMVGNIYKTYMKGSTMAHVYYVPYSREMRVVMAENPVLPELSSPTYTKVCEPTVSLLGLGNGGSTGGLGMIIRLEDGTFVIVDGGHNTKAEGDGIYNTLKKLSPTDHVVISAWIITHGHSDHYGAFLKFSEYYGRSGKFTVKSFMFNFCDTEEQKTSTPLTFSSTLNTIATYWSDATIYKPLTGQVYHFAGCDVEILYCMSDFLPTIFGQENISDTDSNKVDGNLSNLVHRFIFDAGQTLMSTGDTSKINVDEMCARYGTYLKSDIITVPHHGHNRNSYRARNGTVEFYKLVDPSIVLWPDVEAKVNERLEWNGKVGANYEANYYLIHKLNVKQLIIAGYETTTITIPHVPAN